MHHAVWGEGKFWNQDRRKSGCGGSWDESCSRTRHLVRSTNWSHFSKRSCVCCEKTSLQILSVLSCLYPFPVTRIPNHSRPQSIKKEQKLKSAIKPSVLAKTPAEGWDKPCPQISVFLSTTVALQAEHRSQSHGKPAHGVQSANYRI